MEKIIATNSTIKDIVRSEIRKLGIEADLNHIDVSNVTNISGVFHGSKFNGDISKWDVSNVVRYMDCTFVFSQFNGDISKLDTSRVTNMSGMFAFSQFNGDISDWNVDNVTSTEYMFHKCFIKELYKPGFINIV